MEQETLDNWTNGNRSMLERFELIQLIEYYETWAMRGFEEADKLVEKKMIAKG